MSNAPKGWTCDPKHYGANDGCDCECGVVDPDCLEAFSELIGCEVGVEACIDGVCVEIPEEWTCDKTLYAAQDGCDCNCGVEDPDCIDQSLIYNCDEGDSCFEGECTDRDPTVSPTSFPTTSPYPTKSPTFYPSNFPSTSPTHYPTSPTTLLPSQHPTDSPTTASPTNLPTDAPTVTVTEAPTVEGIPTDFGVKAEPTMDVAMLAGVGVVVVVAAVVVGGMYSKQKQKKRLAKAEEDGELHAKNPIAPKL